ncbi:unnamed protein product, partial [Ceratitis capitata]
VKLLFSSRLNNAYKVESPILLKPDKTFKWEKDQWRNYILGEPTFNKSDRIDVVIGSHVRADIRVLQQKESSLHSDYCKIEQLPYLSPRYLAQLTKVAAPRDFRLLLQSVGFSRRKYIKVFDAYSCLQLLQKSLNFTPKLSECLPNEICPVRRLITADISFFSVR